MQPQSQSQPSPSAGPSESPSGKNSTYRRSRSYVNDAPSSSLQPEVPKRQRAHSTSRANGSSQSPNASPSSSKSGRQVLRRSTSGEKYSSHHHSPGSSSVSPLAYERGHPLAPIPGSPYNTDASPPSSPSKKSPSRTSTSSKHSTQKDKDKDKDKERHAGLELNVNGTITMKDTPRRKSTAPLPTGSDDGLTRSRSSKSTKSAKSASFVPYRTAQPQSLNAALEKLALSSSLPGASTKKDGGSRLAVAHDERTASRHSTSLGRASGQGFAKPRLSTDPSGVALDRRGSASANACGNSSSSPTTPTTSSIHGTAPTSANGKSKAPSSPTRAQPSAPQLGAGESSSGTTQGGNNKQWMVGMVGREISEPVFDLEATQKMSPVKMRNAGRPILVEQPPKDKNGEAPWDAELGIYTHRKKGFTKYRVCIHLWSWRRYVCDAKH